MSRTVCSWCKAPLVLKDDVLVCSNTDCPACDEKYLHEELIRTRKALDVAKERLKNIILDVEILATPEYIASRAKETLEEINKKEEK